MILAPVTRGLTSDGIYVILILTDSKSSKQSIESRYFLTLVRDAMTEVGYARASASSASVRKVGFPVQYANGK